jgi:hypothetical protein
MITIRVETLAGRIWSRIAAVLLTLAFLFSAFDIFQAWSLRAYLEAGASPPVRNFYGPSIFGR